MRACVCVCVCVSACVCVSVTSHMSSKLACIACDILYLPLYRYKNNLRTLYIVHPNWWFKVGPSVCVLMVSKKKKFSILPHLFLSLSLSLSLSTLFLPSFFSLSLFLSNHSCLPGGF